MPDTAGFLIEDFLEAVSAQLDRTQDALRSKAVNRPLTFAIKDFAIDLSVFVDLDPQGRVRFRPSSAGENGASTVKIAFTTITRTMIEENTVGLEMSQSTPLAEIGMDPDEQRRLERLGVRTTAQLRNYSKRTGDDGEGLSRLAGVSADRLRQALQMSRPRLDRVTAEPPRGGPPPPNDGPPRDRYEPPILKPLPPRDRPPSHGGPAIPPRPWDEPPILKPWPPKPPPVPSPLLEPGPIFNPAPSFERAPKFEPAETPPVFQPREEVLFNPSLKPELPLLRVAPDVSRLRLAGDNMVENGRAPIVRLDGRILSVAEAGPRAVLLDLPDDRRGGTLEVELPDGRVDAYALSFGAAEPSDSWYPSVGRS